MLQAIGNYSGLNRWVNRGQGNANPTKPGGPQIGTYVSPSGVARQIVTGLPDKISKNFDKIGEMGVGFSSMDVELVGTVSFSAFSLDPKVAPPSDDDIINTMYAMSVSNSFEQAAIYILAAHASSTSRGKSLITSISEGPGQEKDLVVVTEIGDTIKKAVTDVGSSVKAKAISSYHVEIFAWATECEKALKGKMISKYKLINLARSVVLYLFRAARKNTDESIEAFLKKGVSSLANLSAVSEEMFPELSVKYVKSVAYAFVEGSSIGDHLSVNYLTASGGGLSDKGLLSLTVGLAVTWKGASLMAFMMNLSEQSGMPMDELMRKIYLTLFDSPFEQISLLSEKMSALKKKNLHYRASAIPILVARGTKITNMALSSCPNLAAFLSGALSKADEDGETYSMDNLVIGSETPLSGIMRRMGEKFSDEVISTALLKNPASQEMATLIDSVIAETQDMTQGRDVSYYLKNPSKMDWKKVGESSGYGMRKSMKTIQELEEAEARRMQDQMSGSGRGGLIVSPQELNEIS